MMDKDLNQIDKLVNGKLQTHAVDSTVNSWAVISRKMAWRNFLYFRFSSINVYYVSLFLIATIWGSLSYTKSNSTSMSAGSYAVVETIGDIHSQEINDNDKIITLNDSQNSPDNTELINTNDQLKTGTSIKANKIDQINSSNPISNRDKQTIKNSKELQSSEITSTNLKTDDLLSEITHNNKIEVNNSGITNTHNINQKVSSLNSDKSFEISESANDAIFGAQSATSKQIEELSFDFRNSNIESINPLFLENMMQFSDNNLQPEYRRNDSLEFYTSPSDRTSWYLEAHFSPLYTSNVTESIDPEMTSFIDTKSEIESPVLSFTTGLNIMYQGKRNILLETGVAYTQLGERIKRDDIEQITTDQAPLYADGGYFNYDTIPFINLDSLMQGIHYVDTLIESTWIVDNSTYEKKDTTTHKGTNTRNKYSYIEIPVIAGYNFPGPGFDLQVKAGIITGFWLNSGGMKANPDNSMELIDMNSDSPDYRKINYSFTAGFNVNYPITERINLRTGLMYRKNLFDLHNSYVYNQRQKGTQLHLGIQYRL